MTTRTEMKEVLNILEDKCQKETPPYRLEVNGYNKIPDDVPAGGGGNTKIVWVVATDSLSSTSFDWYPNELLARNQYENDKSFVMKVSNTQQHLFAFEVDASLSAEEVTDEVDEFYDEHCRSKEFNMSKLVDCYPFTAEAWVDMVGSYEDFLEK